MRAAVIWLVGGLVSVPAFAGELRVTLQAPAPEAPAPQVQAAPPPTAWEIPLPLAAPRAPAPAPTPGAVDADWVVFLPKKPGKAPKKPKISLKDGVPSPQVAYVAPGEEAVFASKQPASLRFTGESVLALADGRARRSFAEPGAYPYQVEGGEPGLLLVGKGVRCVAAEGDTVSAKLEAGDWRVLVVRSGAVIDAGEVSIPKEGKTEFRALLPAQ